MQFLYTLTRFGQAKGENLSTCKHHFLCNFSKLLQDLGRQRAKFKVIVSITSYAISLDSTRSDQAKGEHLSNYINC